MREDGEPGGCLVSNPLDTHTYTGQLMLLEKAIWEVRRHVYHSSPILFLRSASQNMFEEQGLQNSSEPLSLREYLEREKWQPGLLPLFLRLQYIHIASKSKMYQVKTVTAHSTSKNKKNLLE